MFWFYCADPVLSARKGRPDLAVFAQGEYVLVFGEHLNANLVGAGGAVFVNAAQDPGRYLKAAVDRDKI